MSRSARGVSRWVAAVLLAGCDGGPPRGDAVAQVEPPAARSPMATPMHGTRAAPPFDCSVAIEDYLAFRTHMVNRCKQDRDCAEIWPGLCPHGPYYVDRDADDLDRLFTDERRIAARCEVPKCERPPELGIARCLNGTCVAGRPPAESPAGRACFHYRETHLEARGAHDGATATGRRAGTPRVVIAPIGPGTLRVAIDWPRDCVDCKLAVWSGPVHEERTLDVKPVRTEDARENGEPVRREHFELPIERGPGASRGSSALGSPLTLIPTAAAPVPYRLRTELLDETGHPGAVYRRGTSWDTDCEARG